MSLRMPTQSQVTRTTPQAPYLQYALAETAEEVLASQRLRYQIFAEEQGAVLETAHLGLDCDYYDSYCQHLLVKELVTGRVVGSTRILTLDNARKAGSFYSENEFNLRKLLPLPGKVIEIGRTCIHPEFRNGAGIGMLWAGLAQFVEQHQIDYLFGCASVSMRDGGAQAAAIMQYVQTRHLAPESMRVQPLVRLLPTQAATILNLPPLLKSYLKLGAWVAGEPCLDPDFNVADIFILLDMQQLDQRYQRHFIQSALQRHTLH